MTREEAKRRLLNIERSLPNTFCTKEEVRNFEALEMAIKSLEQEPSVEFVKTEESNNNGTKYLNINVSDDEVKRNPDIVRLCSDVGMLEYAKPSGDAISRQAVLKAIDVKAWEFCDYLISEGRNDEQKPVSHFADNLRECVGEDLPPVNPQEPKTGHWVMPVQDDGMSAPIYYQVRCSECGFDLDPQTWHQELHQYGADKYCPNCGCAMKRE